MNDKVTIIIIIIIIIKIKIVDIHFLCLFLTVSFIQIISCEKVMVQPCFHLKPVAIKVLCRKNVRSNFFEIKRIFIENSSLQNMNIKMEVEIKKNPSQNNECFIRNYQ